MERLAQLLADDGESFVIDSLPIPTCKSIGEKQSRACRRPEYDEVLANKGFNAILGGYFIGYKIHVITTESGVYRDLLLTAGSVHDSAFLRELNADDVHLSNRQLLGDRDYLGRTTPLRLFNEVGIPLDVPYRRDQKD